MRQNSAASPKQHTCACGGVRGSMPAPQRRLLYRRGARTATPARARGVDAVQGEMPLAACSSEQVRPQDSCTATRFGSEALICALLCAHGPAWSDAAVATVVKA
eukprot:scaffold14311_cov44-Phaeocystis_antarctica.AAC.1